jgi:hypothetical protein
MMSSFDRRGRGGGSIARGKSLSGRVFGRAACFPPGRSGEFWAVGRPPFFAQKNPEKSPEVVAGRPENWPFSAGKGPVLAGAGSHCRQGLWRQKSVEKAKNRRKVAANEGPARVCPGKRAQGTPLSDVLQCISVRFRKKQCSTEAVEHWHAFANPRDQAGGQAGLPARSQTDRLTDYFENCNPGSFGLPFFRRNRSWFEPVIVTSPSIFWPSLRVRTSSFPCWV